MSYYKMAAIQLLLLLACVALSSTASIAATSAQGGGEVEVEAEAEAAGAAELTRALAALQAALGDGSVPWARRLQAAQEALAPVLAALDAHAATVLLHKKRRLDHAWPALQERLEGARDLLAKTHQDLMTSVSMGAAGMLSDATAAVARARDCLAGLLSPPGEPEGPQPTDAPHADH